MKRTKINKVKKVVNLLEDISDYLRETNLPRDGVSQKVRNQFSLGRKRISEGKIDLGASTGKLIDNIKSNSNQEGSLAGALDSFKDDIELKEQEAEGKLEKVLKNYY